MDKCGESVSLTTEWQTFTLEQTTTGFRDDDSRVLFDLVEIKVVRFGLMMLVLLLPMELS